MEIADLVTPASVIANLRAANKRQALQELAKRGAALTGRHERAIFEVLLERERLNTTGIGNGTALPHGRLPDLPRLYGLFARLERPIDFEAIDGKPTHLFFALVAPENSAGIHLKALARISRLFKNPSFRQSILQAKSSEEIYQLIANEDSRA